MQSGPAKGRPAPGDRRPSHTHVLPWTAYITSFWPLSLFLIFEVEQQLELYFVVRDWAVREVCKILSSLIKSNQKVFGRTWFMILFIYLFRLSCVIIPEKAMASHSGVLARRIPGTGEPVGSHRVGHDWSDSAAAAAAAPSLLCWLVPSCGELGRPSRCGVQAAHSGGFSCCRSTGSRAHRLQLWLPSSRLQAQLLWSTGWAALRHMGSSQIRD